MADPISSAFATYGSTEADHHRGLSMNDATESSLLLDQTAESSQDNNDDGSIYKYWLFLFLAILLEVFGTTAMKLSDGLTKVLPTIMIYVAYGLSFVVFPLALKHIDLSTAYAIWSGVGTMLTCIIGFVYFGDSINWMKIVAIICIIAGCVVLKFAE